MGALEDVELGGWLMGWGQEGTGDKPRGLLWSPPIMLTGSLCKPSRPPVPRTLTPLHSLPL